MPDSAVSVADPVFARAVAKSAPERGNINSSTLFEIN
jgi:hypothetical protein